MRIRTEIIVDMDIDEILIRTEFIVDMDIDEILKMDKLEKEAVESFKKMKAGDLSEYVKMMKENLEYELSEENVLIRGVKAEIVKE